MSWAAVGAVCLACYLLKLLGMSVPPSWVTGRPWLAGVSRRLPVALLAALVATGTVTSGVHLVLDARLAGLAAAVLLLAVRAPLILVVVTAAAVTAALRLLAPA